MFISAGQADVEVTQINSFASGGQKPAAVRLLSYNSDNFLKRIQIYYFWVIEFGSIL
tara:strand:- start:556 stop:726 length:171 start_codon:yes stop_codon:yes gene_type:complete